MVDNDIEVEDELDAGCFIPDRLGPMARRRMCPLYASADWTGRRKSVQPMAARLSPGIYESGCN